MMKSLQQAVLDHVEPPLTWRYNGGVRLWPFGLAALTALALAFSFLVLSNYNSQTCARVLQFRDWQTPSAAACQVLEEATGDWSQFMMQMPPGYLNVLLHPLALSSSLSHSDTYSPRQCADIRLRAVDMTIIFVRYTNNSSIPYYAGIIMDVDLGFEPALRLTIRGFVEAVFTPFLTQGAMRMHSDNYTAGQRPTQYNGTLSPRVMNNTIFIFWSLLSAQAQLMTVSACAQFVSEKHLMECWTCFGDSWSTIVWIIIIGSIQAVALIDGAAVWCLRLHNRRHQLEPRGAYDSQVALADGETPFLSLLPV